MRNNVIYNGREGFVHHNIVASDKFNIIGNKYIAGPSISLAPFWFDPENPAPPILTEYWMEDNLVEDPGVFNGVVNNPWTNTLFQNEYTFACCGIVSGQFNQSGEFDFTSDGSVSILTHSSNEIEDLLAQQVGAFPRDIVSRTSINDLQTRSGQWDNFRPADLMDGLTVLPPPLDSDNDGMPDSWENQNGLNPNNGSDHNTIMPSGYTAIEEYINGLATAMVTDLIFQNGFE